MSLTSDLKSYADTALAQGKQVVGQAQAQLSDVTETVTGLTGKAAVTLNDLRTQAEKTLNLDALRHVVEPYLSQAKGYGSSVTDRAEGLFAGVSKDPRVAKAIATGQTLAGTVVVTVQQRVVTPVRALTRRSSGAATGAVKSSASTTATKPATTRPARGGAATAPAKKATARKAPAKKTAAE